MTEKSLIDEQFENIRENYSYICSRIEEAAKLSGRTKSDIRFMAVTKTVQPVLINSALSLGIDLIGENKVQELLLKKDLIRPADVEKHLIGHLQSNKVRKIVGEVSMIESVDSESIAQEISKQSANAGLITDILLEVNIGEEDAKTGFRANELAESAEYISGLSGIRVRGLMAVPPVCEKAGEVRRYFDLVRNLYDKLGNGSWDTLSLGMSADYYEAILSGSTLVRIGSALFGQRRY